MAGVDEKKNFFRFVFFSYSVFWFSFAIMGLALFLKVPSAVFTVLKNASAWTPTFVVLAMYRRLLPGISFREFLTQNFLSRIHTADFLFAFFISFFALAAATGLSCMYSHAPFFGLSFIVPAQILPVLIVNLTSGPMGEELGWRAYALGDLKKRHSPLASAVILAFLVAIVKTNFLVQFACVSLCCFIIALVLVMAKRKIMLRRP